MSEQHLKLRDAAKRLAHTKEWLRKRVAKGDFEAFKHGPNDVTVSIESIEAYEVRTRVQPRNVEK